MHHYYLKNKRTHVEKLRKHIKEEKVKNTLEKAKVYRSDY